MTRQRTIPDGDVMYTRYQITDITPQQVMGARCSSVVRAFAYGVLGCWIDPSWWTH